MPWLLLYGAIVFEVAGTTALKLSHGLTKVGPFAASLALYGVSFVLMSLSLRDLPISVAYAIWAGMGTVAIALIGFLGFREPMTPLRMLFMLMVVVGAVGLNLSAPPTPPTEPPVTRK